MFSAEIKLRWRRTIPLESVDAARVVRYVPGELARAMVGVFAAVVSNVNGRAASWRSRRV